LGVGGASADSLPKEQTDRPPTSNPSPPRARARGVEGSFQTCARSSGTTNSIPDSYSNDRYTSAFSRHDVARALRIVVPPKKEGAGNAGCALHPRSRAQRCAKESAHEHTGSAEALRHSLRNGFTAYFVISPENRALLSPSPANRWLIRARLGRLAFSQT